MTQVFATTLQKLLFGTVGYGNCRAVETVENELPVFHRSHALGKLGKNTAEFPTVPTASTARHSYEEKENVMKKGKRLPDGLCKIK